MYYNPKYYVNQFLTIRQMPRKCIYLGEDLHEQFTELGEFGESYSAMVRKAIREYIDRHGGEAVND